LIRHLARWICHLGHLDRHLGDVGCHLGGFFRDFCGSTPISGLSWLFLTSGWSWAAPPLLIRNDAVAADWHPPHFGRWSEGVAALPLNYANELDRL
jgi:hypothetical protein